MYVNVGPLEQLLVDYRDAAYADTGAWTSSRRREEAAVRLSDAVLAQVTAALRAPLREAAE